MNRRSPATLCGALATLAFPTIMWRDLWPAALILALLAMVAFGPSLLDYASYLEALHDAIAYFHMRVRALDESHRRART